MATLRVKMQKIKALAMMLTVCAWTTNVQAQQNDYAGRVQLNSISPSTLKTFVQAVDLVRREYVDDIDDDALFYHAINGMLNRIDKHAEFLDPKALANLQSFTEGHVAGVGLRTAWKQSENHWVVTEVFDDSPAAQAGIHSGDYLHQIGEVKLNASHSENDIVQLLSGISGTSVDVIFSKQGRSKKHSNLIRNQAEQSNIELGYQNGIAIVKLPVFQNNTRQQILDKISLIGSPVQGIIIDVRNNPGGVLESAVDVASLFMRKKVVTYVKNRNGVERTLHTQGSPILESIPVIVLQNRYSASASEVLSSSLQTHDRALIVGETSYGKGSVQSIILLDNDQAIKLTTAHYLTASESKIDGIGVVPDVTFDLTADEFDVWLERAMDLMEQGKLHDDESIEFSPVGGF